MKNKILIIGVLAVFMLVTISMATAISTEKTDEKKESPLFKIRVQNAMQEKKQRVNERMHNFFVKLISDRIFLHTPLIKRDVDNGPYVLSTGGPCTLIKCSLEKEDALEIDWTKLQPICWK